MKTKTYVTLMTAAALASLLLLGACGKKEESKTADSSSKTVQTASSSKAAGSSKASSSAKAGSSTVSENTGSQSVQSESPADQGQSAAEAAQPQPAQSQQSENPQSRQQSQQQAQSAQPAESNRQLQNKQAAGNARYKGVLTMVDGDFSAAAGSWQDGSGNTMTVSADGQFTLQSANGTTQNYYVASYSYTLDDGKYNAQLGGGQGGKSPAVQITTGADGSVTSLVFAQP
ncbi:Flagellar hook-length control protein FliK [Streptococcus sp. DD11]|uniref:DUF6287 domain-containing protein n=1 Tax=Streptococcus sp. DD11 TaxID=1777879 RepID=UPI0007925C0D|nr:DUF6287 domain-containing protein [Streptococcus sp. DD11]KXT85174.1 Flagellar hook-length control protein FliK [Streptococcus sp. DD11]